MLTKRPEISVLIATYALVSGAFADEKVKDTWWSWKPLKEIKAPVVDKSNPIDRFIASKLKEQGLFMSEEADRRVLIRRLYFDLWGMPPTPKEVNDFIKDSDSEAYKNLVDKLLISPRYGERWARHWLDVVHYGETHGYDKDKPRPNAWPYRDYVIRAFNEDKPYSRFIKEQVAGDLLWPDTADGIVATGFIATGPWDYIGHEEVPETKIDGKVARHLDRDDMVTTTMNTFTSLTVQCAQCHDHKIDPVTMEHYYSLQSVFAALDRADRPYDAGPEKKQLIEKKKAIEHSIATVYNPTIIFIGIIVSFLIVFVIPLWFFFVQEIKFYEGKPIPISVVITLSVSLFKLVILFFKTKQYRKPIFIVSIAVWMLIFVLVLEVDIKDLRQRNEKGRLAKSLLSINSEINETGMVYAGTVHSGSGPGSFKGRGHTGGKPRDIFVLHRGEVTDPREPVSPGTVPGIVSGIPHQFNLPEDHKEGDRRVALANWISHKENTLTWRSIVNRVWHYHFGRGIVDTPNDFGRIGSEPTHPELLDWLAIWFRDNNGSIKDLHRLILNSETYKQVSDHHIENAEIDISNQYLWRQNRRRLDAESLRDTVLFVSGKMNFKMGGPSFKDFVIEKPDASPHYHYHKYDPDDPLTHRRSVYRFIVRSQPQPFMDTFDCADPSQLVDKRGETTTALQALALLNNPFMVRMSQRFAENISGNPDPVRKAFEMALSRVPAKDELDLLSSYEKRHGLAATCRIIFNLNEFSFIE